MSYAVAPNRPKYRRGWLGNRPFRATDLLSVTATLAALAIALAEGLSVFADTLRHKPFLLTAGGILVGTAFVASRCMPAVVVGTALIVAGLLVPLLRFVLVPAAGETRGLPSGDQSADTGGHAAASA